MAWEPLPHEADLFCNVYIDETSQNGHRYFIIGGIVVPLAHAGKLEQDLRESRDVIISPVNKNGRPRILKWQKVGAYNVAAYKNFIDAFFLFAQRSNLPVGKHVDLNCVAVDTVTRNLRASGEGDPDIGYNKELYFLCAVMMLNRFKKQLLHVYLDRRTTSHSLSEAKNIMNAGALKHRNRSDWPIRRLRFEDPENRQTLQATDILIGALAYRLNRHYEEENANPAKKRLCDYIMRRAKIENPFISTAYNNRQFSVMHRNQIFKL